MRRSCFFLLGTATLLSCAQARGINTFVSSLSHATGPGRVYTQMSGATPSGADGYVDAPQARAMVPPPLRLTGAGKVMSVLHSLFPSGDANPPLHDPVSGSAIDKFGEAYAVSGPMGTGIAPH
ncbi:hypothetical protein [Gluconobacter kanchanaburiensis]|uniref:Uncharacterized protein n=1 Tax=Gluconobacter kanchanaburiensis NBRC 103587 TaxID=1307948 RepID=A0A511B3F8_9PROT|nr:hypothetical protein [Gluconobacter kanchanaburiensis]GBR69894.1 hypothetical protein AA103587_1575 [Gluconobacter kanchanaburiensis NBRC 103587]GEK94985.1 hypothetical protein GKA01_01820 [Gluconobacter kanchanaburiensis NBRC 103587]